MARAASLSVKSSDEQSPEPLHVWVDRVGYAIRNLGDRSILNRSPLARLGYVEKLAKDKYAGQTLPRGVALRDILMQCVDAVVSEVGDEPGLARVCEYLKLSLKGLSNKEISKQMDRCREHVSRAYRKKALELVTEKFLYVVRKRRSARQFSLTTTSQTHHIPIT